TGVSTVHATATVNVSGVNIGVDTNGYGANIVENTKTWVDARISIQTDGTNQVGDEHTFTVTVEKDLGDGGGWVAASGVVVTATESGAGAITDQSDCADGTDGSGQCLVVVDSSVTGVSTVHATATVNVSGVNIGVDTNGYGANIVENTKTWVDARITIVQAGTNRVGEEHTFTVTVEKDLGDGGGFVAAAGVNVLASEVGVGDIVGGTCDNSGGDTDVNGQCTIIVDSSVPGLSTVHATATVNVSGVLIDVDTNGYGAHDISNTKVWVDASITIDPDDTNEVGDPHTFTVTVLADTGSGNAPVTEGNVDVVLTDSNGSAAVLNAAASTCDDNQPSGDNLDSNGQCIVVFTSDAAGLVSGHATANITVEGVPITIETDGTGDNSDDAEKTFVDAYITIAADDTNEVGVAHTFTVTVYEDAGDGAGFVAAAGELVTITFPGGAPGTVNDDDCDTTGTDALGQCFVVINSAVAGVFDVHAASNVQVGGLSLARETDGVAPNSGDATKTYVDAYITIEADDTNEINDAHTFTVYVAENDGTGWADAAGEIVTITFPGGAPGTVVDSDCTDGTDATGNCYVIVNSAVAGVFDVHAASNVQVGGLSLARETDGVAPNSGDATKTYVDARISIAADETNEVGDPHTFTVLVEGDDGTGWAPVAGELVTITFPGGAPGTVNDDDCDTTGTDALGQCFVVINSAVPGIFTAHAAASITVGGLELLRETDGLAGNSDDAVKTYVDAYITIEPDDTNGITEAHTFTVYVAENDGTGWVDAAGEIVTITWPGGSGTPGTVNDSDCTDGTAADGTCLVIINSNVEGTFNAHAAVSVSVGGITVHRETDGTGSNSDDAVKVYVDGSLTWLKHDNNGQLLGGATFEVCRTHDRFGTDIVDECVTIVDDVDGVDDTTGDWDGTPGEFKLGGLLLGTYTIEETVAPPTYTLDSFVDTVVLTLAAPDGAATHIWVNTPPSEGCTPGFWKRWTNVWNDGDDAIVAAITAYVLADGDPLTVPTAGVAGATSSLFRETFGITPAQMTAAGLSADLTLEQAINTGGGGFNALVRHGTAGLLASVSVNYPLTIGQVLDGVQAAFVAGDYNLNNILTNVSAFNELDHKSCPKSDPSD
ncbi:MAG: prealbumin-like fold domain-containing protein, partial [Chloroflexota bacterium]